MTVRLRPARDTDAGALGTILSEFIDRTNWMPRIHTRAQDISFTGMMIDRGWVTVVSVGARPTGFIARDGSEINALYIAEHARRQGIGTMLLEDAKARVDRLTLWTFEANAPAHAFYARHGFSEAARTDGADNDEHLPDIQFIWKKEP